MLKEIISSFRNKKYLIATYEYGIYIYNYIKIINLTNTDADILLERKIVKIKGNNMKILKLLKNELLINGDIIDIKLEDYE